MASDIEKLKIRERIKISSFKHRGNVMAIAKETGYEEGFIIVELQKLKKATDRNVNEIISSTMMQYLFDGHQQRISYIQEMLRSLDNTESVELSDCCKAPIRLSKNSAGIDINKCRICDAECKPSRLTQTEIYHLKMKLIEALKAEDASLVLFLSKMGYSNAPPIEKSPIIKQDFIVLNRQDKKTGKVIDAESETVDLLTMQQIENMPPAERDKLRNDLKKTINDIAKQASNQEVQ